MSREPVERERAASLRPAARKNVNLHAGYSAQSVTSSRDLLERAADVLLLMQYPLTVTERAGFGMLLQRRLERAYGGLGNG